MVKVYNQLPRRPDITREAFQLHWKTVHAAGALRIRRLRRYVQNHVITGEISGWNATDADGIVETWFSDLESALALPTDPDYVEGALLDEPNFIDVARFAAGPSDLTLYAHEDVIAPGPYPHGPARGVKAILFLKRTDSLSPTAFNAASSEVIMRSLDAAIEAGITRIVRSVPTLGAYRDGAAPADAVLELSSENIESLTGDALMSAPLFGGLLPLTARDSCKYCIAREHRVIWP
jgi:hypothetical protein